ncbi:MAG TPA: hypothetical protein VN455_01215 [Methanotrichaceae archaeon]|nr:hypothetical protein [Methanotrichaceae archaeon]
MEFQQSGNTLTGKYTHDDGRIQGTISGNKLIGTWTEVPTRSPPNDAGDVELTLSDDCNSISGNWRYGSSGGWSGDWSGTRTGTPAPACDRLLLDLNEGPNSVVIAKVVDACEHNPLKDAVLDIRIFHTYDKQLDKAINGDYVDLTPMKTDEKGEAAIPVNGNPGDIYRVDVYASKEGWDTSDSSIHITIGDNSVSGSSGGNTNGGSQLVGSWNMAGHQAGFNDWEADLVLSEDGTLRWTETKGANVGATRTGTWRFDGTTFTMSWVSPDGGKTIWTSESVSGNSISGGTYTVASAPGGSWSATRVSEGF